jgi:MscS family membrane protein
MFSSQANSNKGLQNSINNNLTRLSGLVLIFVLTISISYSQDSVQVDKEEESYSLNSPKQTVFTHLKFLQEESYNPEIAGKVFYEEHLEGRNPQQLAIRLKQVFDAKGYYIDLEDIPSSPNYFDSLVQRNAYILIPNEDRVALRKIGNKWYYSKKTVDAINDLFTETFPFGTHRLVEFAPRMGSGKILGLHVWQHLALLIMILVAFIIQRLLTFLFEGIIRRLLLRIGYGRVANEVGLPRPGTITAIGTRFVPLVSERLLQVPRILRLSG